MDLINLNCTGCDLHTTRTNVVPGDGNTTSPIMWVAEAPGHFEDEAGCPLVNHARTGKEYNWLLARHGFLRPLQYVTNLIKCHPPGDKNPTPTQIEACSKWLERELDQVNPSYIVTIGYFATNYFLPGTTLEAVHGIPFEVDDRVIIPIYHPAAGFHQPATMMNVHLDFRTVAEIVKGNLPTRHLEDEYAGREEYHVLTDEDLLISEGL